MPLQRVQRETTATEYVEWCHFLELEWNNPSRSDFYAAQTAAEVRKLFAKNPRNIKTEDLLLTFDTGAHKKSKQVSTEQSKAFWFAFTGYDPEED